MISRLFYQVSILLLLAHPLQAANTIQQVSEQIKVAHGQSVQESRLQNKSIDVHRNELMQQIEALKTDLQREEGLMLTEKEDLAELARHRDSLQHEIATRLASKEELDSIFTDHIRNFLALSEKSPHSGQHPGNIEKLEKYLRGDRIFGPDDISGLMEMYFTDITEGAQQTHFNGEVLDRRGEMKQATVTRLGHMSAMFDDGNAVGFLTFSPSSKRLLMSGDPGFFHSRAIKSYIKGDGEEVPIDLSGGVAVSQLSRKETIGQRLKNGGVLVYPIVLVGLVAIILVTERLFFLSKVRHNTDELMTNVTKLVQVGEFEEAVVKTKPHSNRPTGCVLMSGLRHRNDGREVIESAISEAILAQGPRLERFLGALKVLAAVAPLLGLLGTVTGMINTFQVITVHGTGDPRLMAGGISEAMITTQVGLAVAIPIMMSASFLGGRVKNLSRDMEEKGIALMGALIKQKASA